MKQYSIRDFIRWFNGKKKIAALILLALTIGFGVLAGVLNSRPAPDPVPMDEASVEVGDYAYIDAIGVSDWVYQPGKSTTYYLVMDENHYSYVVKIPDKEIGQYTAQNLWFEGKTDEEVPVRITGRVKKMNDVVKQAFIEVWELKEDEFEMYFAEQMLWAGETPSGATGSVFIFFAVLTGIGAAALLFPRREEEASEGEEAAA